MPESTSTAVQTNCHEITDAAVQTFCKNHQHCHSFQATTSTAIQTFCQEIASAAVQTSQQKATCTDTAIQTPVMENSELKNNSLPVLDLTDYFIEFNDPFC